MSPRLGYGALALFLFGSASAISLGQTQGARTRSPAQRTRPEGTTPGTTEVSAHAEDAAQFPGEFRTIDGVGNNLFEQHWGAADTAFRRWVDSDYGDGLETPAGGDRPSPRAISNGVAAQEGSIPNHRGASDYVWMWGQFLDHDLTETPIAAPLEAFDIIVPTGDVWFDPTGTGAVTIPLDRSAWDLVSGVRQQVNAITAFIDASNVYGSDAVRASELRTLDGTGTLKTSAGDLLPFNLSQLPNAPSTSPNFFLAGDVRANEQVALTAMHTLFVREHNFWAARLRGRGMQDGETIYQVARALVTAEMQAITYREFLPAVLGQGALRPYHGYRPDVDPGIANVFATAAYRFGHTMLSPQLLRVQADGTTHPSGHLDLASAFFSPDEITTLGIDPYLRGLARQQAQEIDPYLIDAVRNFLFGPPGSGGFDLAALNIQRGRDHGLPSYNDLRQAAGGPRAQDFGDVTQDPEIRARLAATYVDVDAVDAWVGLLSERHAPGALVGRTLRRVLTDQFERLRDGDRFWYEAYLPPSLVAMIETQTLAVILRRNTGLGAELQDDVFHTP